MHEFCMHQAPIVTRSHAHFVFHFGHCRLFFRSVLMLLVQGKQGLILMLLLKIGKNKMLTKCEHSKTLNNLYVNK
jgi:hypothetical protein